MYSFLFECSIAHTSRWFLETFFLVTVKVSTLTNDACTLGAHGDWLSCRSWCSSVNRSSWLQKILGSGEFAHAIGTEFLEVTVGRRMHSYIHTYIFSEWPHQSDAAKYMYIYGWLLCSADGRKSVCVPWLEGQKFHGWKVGSSYDIYYLKIFVKWISHPMTKNVSKKEKVISCEICRVWFL
jgi:hypothetical protein